MSSATGTSAGEVGGESLVGVESLVEEGASSAEALAAGLAGSRTFACS